MLTDQAIDAVAAAIFDKPNPWVAEAYSQYDAKPLRFGSTSELAEYLRKTVAMPRGHAFVFVTYPDMMGRPVRETIHLKIDGSPNPPKLRYTWQGWGLISVQLTRDTQPGAVSRIAANSQSRAEKWAASTYLHWDPPNTWNWNAVTSHARRLQRVLKRVTQIA